MAQARFALDRIVRKIVRERRARFQFVRFGRLIVADDCESMAIVREAGETNQHGRERPRR
jgi:hypothetical protein